MPPSQAPIYQENRPARPARWILDLRRLGGKRESYPTLEEARGARQFALTAAKNRGAAGLALSPGERADFAAARDRLAKLGATVSQAVEFFERHHKGKVDLTLGSAFEQFLAAKQAAGLREKSVRQLRYKLGTLVEAIGAKQPIASVSQAVLEQWLHAPGLKLASVRSRRIDLQTFFRFAMRRGWIGLDPSAHIEAVRLDDKPPGILTVEQVRRLMAACRAKDPGLLAHLSLALFAGVRPEELARMTPGEVNLARGYVEVAAAKAKTRQRRLVDLSDNCRAWMAIAPVELPLVNARARINAVRIAAGFEGWRRVQRSGKELWLPVNGDAWPHDALRHSFASYHLARHGDAGKTALQMGHRSTDMLFRHYRELVPPQEAEKFWTIAPG